MSKRNFLMYGVAVFCIFVMGTARGQEGSLWMPEVYRKAYQQGTRSYDGRPGPEYWQNSSSYRIQVTVDPPTRTLTGTETIRYVNHSPDVLTQLVIRLYQNLYKVGAARTGSMPPEKLHQGVEVTKILLNGEEAGQFSEDGTNATLSLPEGLVPGDSLRLEIHWSEQLTCQGYRSGFYDQSTAFAGYWYPQIAVYDDLNGWDTHQYTGQLEFYNDFADFDVTVSLPDSFIVWGTGVLQNPDQVLENNILRRFRRAQRSDDIIHIVTAEDLEQSNVTRSGGANAWHFRAAGVTDFAFAFSSHYLWDGTSVEVDPAGERRAFIQSAYRADAGSFDQVAEVSRKTVDYLSREMPGIPYPFPTMTVFNGSGGMEYPMMVNESAFSSFASTFGVTSHEIAHTYFPFYMGINERMYAWMDESFATFLPTGLQSELPGGNFRDHYTQRVADFFDQHFPVPIIVTSDQLGRTSYRINSYGKPALAWDVLKGVLGDDMFKQTLQEFMHRWHGKHPMPYDLFFSFNDAAGEDLSWFWKPWFFEARVPDLGIRSVRKAGDTYWVTVENRGGMPAPVDLSATFADQSTLIIHHTASVWQGGGSEVTLPIRSAKNLRSVTLKHTGMIDVNPENDAYRMP